MKPTKRKKCLSSVLSVALFELLLATLLLFVSIVLMIITVAAPKPETPLPVIEHETRHEYADEDLIKPVKTFEYEPESEIPEVPDILVSDEEIELIALVTMAEAEGESEEGKRLVIDTILNRVDSNRWPNTITEVIYQPNQFTSMWNGRVDRCYVREDICELVREELISRTNDEVVYFTAGGYGRYGVPTIQVGNHYFCKL